MENIISAPVVNAFTMWQMKTEDFNDWRRKNDYPRIIEVLKRSLPDFESWMTDQGITDDLLIKYSPSTFLAGHSYIYLYNTIEDGSKERIFISFRKLEDNKQYNKNMISKRKDFIPYRAWYYAKTKKWPSEPSVNVRQGRSCRMFSELELLDLGNCHLVNMYNLGNRLLDFLNLSNLHLTNCAGSNGVNLWFCYAQGITIEGDLAFINAYETSFSGMINRKNENLKLLNGNFQSWTLENCRIGLLASNSTIHLWDYTGYEFEATMNNTDIRECTFKSSAIRYPIDFSRHRNFHAHIKRLYSQIGKKKEASQHYFLEKTYERKSFLHVRENYRLWNSTGSKPLSKYLRKLAYLFKYIYSEFLNLLWGYGERPGRVFLISIVTILLFSCGYCYLPNGTFETHRHFSNSLYYSMVTFTTLGYGDIHQSNQFLKLLSGFEALLGMTFWGILIAGFTSNAKDY